MRDSFCSHCGTAFANTTSYPRTCGSCKVTLWANPIPVSVVIVPVVHGERTGVLVVRRGIPPAVGKLALVGGFLEEHETWQQGGAREVLEETGVRIEPELEPLWFTSTEPKPNRVLLFSVARPLLSLNTFVPNTETLERGLVFGPGGLAEEFAFSLHLEALRRYFSARGVTGPHGFTAV